MYATFFIFSTHYVPHLGCGSLTEVWREALYKYTAKGYAKHPQTVRICKRLLLMFVDISWTAISLSSNSVHFSEVRMGRYLPAI